MAVGLELGETAEYMANYIENEILSTLTTAAAAGLQTWPTAKIEGRASWSVSVSNSHRKQTQNPIIELTLFLLNR